jgi:histidinol-phosphate aminotransferase
MMPLWDLASPQLRALAVYKPGRPVEKTARDLHVDPAEIVKFASNENPLGPSPKAVAAMQRAIKNAHL